MKKFLLKLVIESDSKLGKGFDVFIQCLIIMSLISFSIETLPNLSISVTKALDIFELITVIVFSIELALRLILSSPPLKYILSFYGIIDLLAVLPFYLSTGVDLRSVRIFRLFRLLRFNLTFPTMFTFNCIILNFFCTVRTIFHNIVIFELEVNSTSEVLQKYSN